MNMPRLYTRFFSFLILAFFVLYLLSYVVLYSALTSSRLTHAEGNDKEDLRDIMHGRVPENKKVHVELLHRPDLQEKEKIDTPNAEQTNLRGIFSQSSHLVALASTAAEKGGLNAIPATAEKSSRNIQLQENEKDDEAPMAINDVPAADDKAPINDGPPEEEVPMSIKDVRAANDTIPIIIKDVPAVGDKVPISIKDVPPADDKVSISIKDVPAVDDKVPTAYDTAPINDGQPEDGFFDPATVDPELQLKFVAKPIPRTLVDFVKQLKNPHDLPNCKTQRPKQNFVYIKTHKTASDSLAAMFRRFAYDRNLSVVLPVGLRYNMGWPYDLNKKFHRPFKTGGFNVLLDHSKYTEDYMQEIMPKDTVYITSWRETFSHLKSAISYLHILEYSGINQDPIDGMEVFLQNLKHYDDIYKILPPKNPFRSTYPCIPGDMSMARNSMAADLGFPVGFPPGVYPDHSDNFTAIKEWLEHSNKVFSVVLISDHFHHSLVMMKRMMCWSTKDILYERMNSRNTKYRPEYRQELVDNFRRWSAADYLAFELFNQTLWDRIEKWGHEDFMSELEQYEATLEQTRSFCHTIEKAENVTEKLDVAPTAWDSGFTVNKADCDFIKHHMRDTIKEKYDKIPVQVEQRKGRDVLGC